MRGLKQSSEPFQSADVVILCLLLSCLRCYSVQPLGICLNFRLQLLPEPGAAHCDSIQVAINGATSRCLRACHQCLLNTVASYLFRSPPHAVHHRGCPPSRNPGRLSHTCTRQRRGKHRDTLKKRWFRSNGLRSSSTHSPVTRSEGVFFAGGCLGWSRAERPSVS